MDNYLSNFSPLHSGKQKRRWGPHWRGMTACLQLLREAPSLPRFGKTGQWPKCHCKWRRSQTGKDEAGWNMRQAAQPQVITLSKSHLRSWVTLLNLNSACLNLTYISIPVVSYLLPPHLNLAVVFSIPAEMPSETPCLEALGMRLTVLYYLIKT